MIVEIYFWINHLVKTGFQHFQNFFWEAVSDRIVPRYAVVPVKWAGASSLKSTQKV